MPDVAEYVQTFPDWEKISTYPSECVMGSVVFGQCFVEPKWTVRQAVIELIRKA